MQIRCALLCDFAQVREGLLFVVGGGLTRLWPPQVPVAFDRYLALAVELGPDEVDVVHEAKLVIQKVDDLAAIASGTAGFQFPQPSARHPAESVTAAFAIPLRGTLPSFGQYDVKISVDGEPHGPLSFFVESRDQR